MKKILTLLIPLVVFAQLIVPMNLWAGAGVSSSDSEVTVYFFWSQSCPHCHQEKVFLQQLMPQYPQVKLESMEVSEHTDEFRKVALYFENDRGAVPFTIIGQRKIIGYANDEITGTKIKEMIDTALENGCPDVVTEILHPQAGPSPTPVEEACGDETDDQIESVNIPLIGEVKLRELSLPLLSVVLGFLDGFNPCAMWALVFLISLLLGMEDTTRRWLFGVVFIVTSAVVYFLFMAAWLNLFLFLGLVDWVRMIVGLAAGAIGVYCLRDYWVNRGVCKVGGGQRKQKVFGRLRQMVEQKSFWPALLGIVVLAVAVNMVELICSAGLPAVYTHILSLNNLSAWRYYGYLLIYIFFFMVDDLFVFFAAMVTLHAMGIQSKYAKYSRLIGGIIILIIAGLLLFRPELLMFG